MKEKTLVKKDRGDTRHRQAHRIIGIALFATGVFWFAKQVGRIPAVAGSSGVFWPVAVITLAVIMLVRRGQ